MMKVLAIYACTALAFGVAAERSLAATAEAGQSPPFNEVYQLVRSNLVGAADAELNRAAVLGFVGQLQGRVSLVTNGVAETSSIPLVTRSAAYEGAFGLIRISRVAPGLSQAFATALDQLSASNKLKGLVVDLRFALGQDYAAAGQAADLFFKNEQPLLNWGETTFRSTAKAKAVDLPVVVLINRDTRGAAEAFAAALRQADGSLLIGSASAGQAHLFRDFRLSTGQTVRIASGMVLAGSGQELPVSGLVPDIQIAVASADEKAYFEDPYKVMPKAFAQSVRPGSPLASGQGANRPRRPRNEAELVRMQREGLDFDLEGQAAASAQAAGQVITDPALSRGLDVLKGLAVALKRR
jgi:hypothetical protein